MKKFLVLSAHTDDVELSCGGALHKLIKEGNIIKYIAFSVPEESKPTRFQNNSLRQEFLDAIKILGVKHANTEILNFKVRRFPDRRQEILDVLINVRKEFNPDIVIQPSMKDIHQDHMTLAHEGIRAFRKSSILCYEFPWNNISQNVNFYFPISEKELHVKLRALQCYRSQSLRPYMNPEYIKSLAMIRGQKVGVKYADAFELFQWIEKKDH